MTSQHDKAKRWRPWQFRLSTLLLLTTVVAVAVGWVLDRQRLSSIAAMEVERAQIAEMRSREIEAIAVAEAEKGRRAEAEAIKQVKIARAERDNALKDKSKAQTQASLFQKKLVLVKDGLDEMRKKAYPQSIEWVGSLPGLDLKNVLNSTKSLSFVYCDIQFDGGSLVYRFRNQDGSLLDIALPHPGYNKVNGLSDEQLILVQIDKPRHELVPHDDESEEKLLRLLEELAEKLKSSPSTEGVWSGKPVHAVTLLIDVIKRRPRAQDYDPDEVGKPRDGQRVSSE